MTVPRLTTALAGSLQELERRLLASQADIEGWLRGQRQDRNAPGMQFAPLAFAEPCSSPEPEDPDCPPNRLYAYGVIARLALLAAAIELEQTTPESQIVKAEG